MLSDLVNDSLGGGRAVLRDKLEGALFDIDDTAENRAHKQMIGSFKSNMIAQPLANLQSKLEGYESDAKKALMNIVDSGLGAAQDALVGAVSNVEDKLLGAFQDSVSSDDSTDMPLLPEVPKPIYEEDPIKWSPEPKMNDGTQEETKKAPEPIKTNYKWNLKDTPNEVLKSLNLNAFFQNMASGDTRFGILKSHLFNVSITFPQLTPLDNEANQQGSALKMQTNIFAKGPIFSLLCRSADIPNLTNEGTAISNEFGFMSLPGISNIPDSNKLTISFLNSEYAIHERLMLQWFKQITSDQYVYAEQPFMKATIRIDFFEQLRQKIILSYIFNDCYPQIINTADAKYDSVSDIERPVTFEYNTMHVGARSN